MSIIFNQQDKLTTGQLFAIPFNAAPANVDPMEILIGTTGFPNPIGGADNTQDVSFNAGTLNCGVFYRGLANEPSLATWKAGTWTVQLYLWRRQSNIYWRKVYICRMNTSNAIVNTIGTASFDIQMIPLETLFTQDVDVIADSVGSVTDRVYIVCEFFNAHGIKTKAIAVSTGAIHQSPLEAGAGGVTALPGTAPSTASVLQPTVTTAFMVEFVAAVVGVATVLQPIVSKNENALPGVAPGTASVLQPVVSVSQTATPFHVFALASANQPIAHITQTATPGTVSATASVLEPSVGAPATVTPGTPSAIATVLQPVVTATRDVFPGVVSAAASALQPTVSVPFQVTLGIVTANATVLQPSVAATLLVTPGVVSATASVLQPDVFGAAAAFHVWDGTKNVLIGGTS